MNPYSPGLRIASALIMATFGFLTNLDVDFATALDDADTKLSLLNLLHSSNFGLLEGMSGADADHAHAIEEHISRLA